MRSYTRFAALLTGALLTHVTPLPCAAADAETIELVYEESNGTVSVVGCNMATDGSCPYTGVEIPSTVNGLPVTAIASEAFANCPTLLSVVIPATVTEIATDAFVNWSSIAVWAYPESCAETFALEYAESFAPVIELEITNGEAAVTAAHTGVCEIVIPETYAGCPVTTIGTQAFEFCEALTTVSIPDSVTTIENYAFNECRALTALPLSDNITAIGDGAFAYCTALTELVLPQDITEVPSYLCIGASGLKTVQLPEGVTSIQWSAFSYCTSLQQINIPETVTAIGARAFEACHSLTEITIPASVTSIYSSAFLDTYSVTIYGTAGSKAEEFALEQGIPFVAVDAVEGDLNGDGVCSVADAVALLRCVTEQPDAAGIALQDADRNGDGILDLNDVSSLLNGLSADFRGIAYEICKLFCCEISANDSVSTDTTMRKGKF